MSTRLVALALLAVSIIITGILLPRATLARNEQNLQASIIEDALIAQVESPGSCGVLGNEILDPVPFVWTFETSPEPHYVGVLEYGEWTFDIDGETLTTRAYRQEGGVFSIPGPTLNMVPGNKYVLRFRNLLDYEAPVEDHNVYKDPNISNVHTHGLHISGESPGDDVTRMFEGGKGGDYVYDIPADHMGGTFWYHAHHHGSTFLQVSTGGFGLIVIDDGADGIPSNVALMEERQLLLGYLDPGAAGTGGDTLVSGTLPAGWTVNGKVGGDLCVQRDTWQHWRVLLADRDAKTKDVTVGPNCEVQLLARDGVWRTTAPKELLDSTVNLTGASRADLAVKCSADSDISVAGNTVAAIHVGGTADSGPHPFASDGSSDWTIVRPSYLRDLRQEPVVNTETINMGARTVNGSKFDLNTPTFTVNTDNLAGVQEWSIKGATNHPFHLHVYHMQAQAGCGGDFEEGEYYDTLAASCLVRFDLNPETSTVYSGRTIMHCHILQHEDQGAMGWLDVTGGGAIGPPTFPVNDQGLTSYEEYYALSANPPAAPADLVAGGSSSSTIALSWTDNSSDETSFNIERSDDGGGSFNPVASVGADATTYEDIGLAPDTTYWYHVNAENGAGSSAWSAPAQATTDPLPTAPAAPSNLTAGSPSSSTIDLGWTDNASDEDGFTIERSADGVNFSNIDTVSANTISYSDSSLASAATYYYRVLAYNAGGSSSYSNVASETTLPDAGPTAVTIGSISVTTANIGQGNKRGQATVVVVDDLGNPVPGADVTGSFTGTFNESGLQGTTDGSGTAVIQTAGSHKGNVSLTFCVTSVDYSLPYSPSGTGCASN